MVDTEVSEVQHHSTSENSYSFSHVQRKKKNSDVYTEHGMVFLRLYCTTCLRSGMRCESKLQPLVDGGVLLMAVSFCLATRATVLYVFTRQL